MRVVLLAALAAAVVYAILVGAGDLRQHLALYLASHALLLVLMLLVWRAVARGGPAAFRAMLVAAVVFRLIAAAATPSLSDDVYRYVWDGRVQAAGHHPYRFAPSDPLRSELRDATVHPKINHPEIPTIYPPLAEMLFAVLAGSRLGVTGFKVALALLDAGVVAALVHLLRALGLPRDRVVLYAWNPLAVIEVAASGHVEPLGMLFVLLAVTSTVEGRATRAGAALGGAIQAKLLPLLLVPGLVRRMKGRALVAMLAVVAVTTAPYALRGPWFGRGAVAYAHRWEHGAVLFAGVRRLVVAAHGTVGAQDLSRAAVALAALAWAAGQALRPRLDAAREARLVLGGALLLAPTLHPWYVLWVLPLAAGHLAGGWLLLGALVPLQYLGGVGDVPWAIRLAILLPPLAWMTRDALLGFRR